MCTALFLFCHSWLCSLEWPSAGESAIAVQEAMDNLVLWCWFVPVDFGSYQSSRSFGHYSTTIAWLSSLSELLSAKARGALWSLTIELPMAEMVKSRSKGELQR